MNSTHGKITNKLIAFASNELRTVSSVENQKYILASVYRNNLVKIAAMNYQRFSLSEPFYKPTMKLFCLLKIEDFGTWY
jgi:hypothetical protein